MKTLLSKEECLNLLKEANCPQQVIDHSLQVCQKALALNDALLQPFCSTLIMNASLLHDILRTQPHHPKAAANYLRQMGLNDIAYIIESHHDLNDTYFDERMIIYLADKFIKDTQEVSLEKRFLSKYESFTDDEAKKACLKRYQQARKIYELYERKCLHEMH